MSKSESNIEGNLTYAYMVLSNEGKSRASDVTVSCSWRDIAGHEVASREHTLADVEGGVSVVWNTSTRTQDTLFLHAVIRWTWQTVREPDSIRYEWQVVYRAATKSCSMYRLK